VKALRLAGRLKGTFFLSPREEAFIKRLITEFKVPEPLVEKGLEECLRAVPPERRARFPLFRCARTVLRLYEREKKTRPAAAYGWQKAFKEKARLLSRLLGVKPPEADSPEEAQRVLYKLEEELLRRLWRRLSPSQKKEILELYEPFKSRPEVYRELIKEELRRRFNLPNFTLYSS